MNTLPIRIIGDPHVTLSTLAHLIDVEPSTISWWRDEKRFPFTTVETDPLLKRYPLHDAHRWLRHNRPQRVDAFLRSWWRWYCEDDKETATVTEQSKTPILKTTIPVLT